MWAGTGEPLRSCRARGLVPLPPSPQKPIQAPPPPRTHLLHLGHRDIGWFTRSSQALVRQGRGRHSGRGDQRLCQPDECAVHVCGAAALLPGTGLLVGGAEPGRALGPCLLSECPGRLGSRWRGEAFCSATGRTERGLALCWAHAPLPRAWASSVLLLHPGGAGLAVHRSSGALHTPRWGRVWWKLLWAHG